MPAESGQLVLYRPIGQAELALIRASGRRAFPPRLPHRPIFYPVQTVGAARHQELWIPAEELDAFNAAILGLIEVVSEFRGRPA